MTVSGQRQDRLTREVIRVQTEVMALHPGTTRSAFIHLSGERAQSQTSFLCKYTRRLMESDRLVMHNRCEYVDETGL